MNIIKRALVTLAGIALVVVPLYLVWSARYSIEDYVKLFHYQAPAAVAQLASDDTMTAQARRVFYVNHPQIVASRTAFATDCSVTEQAIVEGCYHSGENGIFIFDVTDKALNGVKQVTAAHEMLHAAYEQLSGSERNYVNGLLMNYYQHDLTSSRIKSEIKLYQKTEPDAWVDEMHSTLGTEVSNLPAPLEHYYQRYFTSRAKVVAFSNQYQAQFTSRQAQVQAYDQQLKDLQAQINALKSELAAESSKISSDRNQINQLASNGDASQYNAAVNSFKSEVSDYNQKVSQYNSLVDEFNSILAQRNALAVNLNTLTSEIDTRPTLQSSP